MSDFRTIPNFRAMSGGYVIPLIVSVVLIFVVFIVIMLKPTSAEAANGELQLNQPVRECQFENNGKLLITTTNDVLFEVNANKVIVTVARPDFRLDGTYVDLDLGRPIHVSPRPVPYSALSATIRVRTPHERDAWNSALEKVIAKFYKPRDVPPPAIK